MALALFLTQLRVVGQGQHAAQGEVIIATVVGETRRSGVGKGARLDKVLASQHYRIKFKFERDDLDHALKVIAGLGSACTAIGNDGCGVG